MRDQGIGSWIERRARITPDRPALVAGGTSRSYVELAGRITRLAHVLRQAGVERGDRVGWTGPNHPAFLETLFASSKLGAVLSPVNHRLDPDAISSVFETSQPRVVVVSEQGKGVPLPSSVRARLVVGDTLEAAIDAAPDNPIDEPVGLSDLCFLPFTSGTTGTPKGVMLTHGNITWNVVNVLASADFRNDDVTIAIAPFFRVGGTGVNVLPTFFMGGTVVVPNATDADEILCLIERHRVTVGFGNPDLLQDLTRSALWQTADLSSVRFAITGGAPVPERLIRTYLSRGVLLVQGYGLSEAAPVVLLLEPERALAKPGSAGRPVLMDDIRTVRLDGSPCAPNETGELLVSGPNVMTGYWNLPEATSRTIDEEGWLHTGDAARVDTDGDVWIVDRLKDRYLSQDHVVFPGDVERAMQEHPAVEDVGVVGVEGRYEGAAFVVIGASQSASESEILEFARKRLPSYAVPRSITIVDAIPRTSVGKILRADLRALAAALPRSDGC